MWAQGVSTGGGFLSSSHQTGVKWDGLGLKIKKKKKERLKHMLAHPKEAGTTQGLQKYSVTRPHLPLLPYSSFRTEFIEGLVKWLDLPDAVLPAMTAFASGLGGEGTETFAQLLLKDPTVKDCPAVITQVSSYVPLVSVWFCKKKICHTCLFVHFSLYS